MVGIVLRLLLFPLLAIYLLVVVVVMDTDESYTHYALIIPISYLLGSIPWGFLVTMVVKGVDIREYGSGKIGTSNVLRSAGGPYAVMALILDLSKGLLAVLLARVVADDATVEIAAGLLALGGHNWSIFLGFKGGRGIAPGLGGLLVMEPLAGAIALAVFVPVTFISRYLSLGSIVSVLAAFLSVLTMVAIGRSSAEYMIYTGVGGAIILWQHRGNIQRLVRGTERRLGQSADRIGGVTSSGVGRS